MSTNVPTTGGEFTAKELNDGKPLAAVGYACLCCIPAFLLPMMAAKENRYAQFHARQGAVLWVTVAAFFIASFVVQTIAGMVSGMLYNIVSCISGIGGIGLLVLMVIGIVNALQGQAKELPLIGPYSTKLPF